MWYISINGQPIGPLDRASAAAEARANSAALCWREGFAEWLPVGEVPELIVEIQIPNYTLLSKLGEGAMADVWLAEHQINKRKAAIKILKPKGLSDEEVFVREGRALASFDHPNIVRIHDQGRVGKLCYLVMECLQGGTLEKRMDPKSPPVTVGEALGLVVQIAGGLEVAHQQQVVHRDLKPANIMLRNDTTPVLTDFGLARFLNRSMSMHAQAGLIVGTFFYMSPEQLTGQELDGRTDLYALGILFFELLTGQRPFSGRTLAEISAQHFYAPLPQLPTELVVLQPVLEQLLAKKKEDRYPTAQAFIDALRLCFLNEVALRQQVGFAATSRAWSSQLRALGFVMDSPQLVDVRIAQGEAEAARLAEEKRRAEAARSAEAKRRAEETEAARIAEEKRRTGAERFVANGNGTVTDTKTGLIWADSDNGSNINWRDARKYCAKKGEGWQLPTVAQLQELYDASGKLSQKVGANTCYVTPLIRLSSSFFWSSDEVKVEAKVDFGSVWLVNFDLGARYSTPFFFLANIRALCVRRS